MSIVRDPLVRRLLSGSLFAFAFIWTAVRYFEVETEVVWVLFVFSLIFVAGLIALGFVFSFLIRVMRPKGGGLLDKIDDEEPLANQEPSANREPSASKEPTANREPSASKEPSAK
jgi:hypothetical protein